MASMCAIDGPRKAPGSAKALLIAEGLFDYVLYRT